MVAIRTLGNNLTDGAVNFASVAKAYVAVTSMLHSVLLYDFRQCHKLREAAMKVVKMLYSSIKSFGEGSLSPWLLRNRGTLLVGKK